jgi:hypothetical protein
MIDDGRQAPVVELAAITIDCGDPARLAAFYAAAFAAEVSHADDTGAWIHVSADLLMVVRTVADYRPPTWPDNEVPLQMHFEMWVDDVTRPDALASWAPPHRVPAARDHDNLVMLVPRVTVLVAPASGSPGGRGRHLRSADAADPLPLRAARVELGSDTIATMRPPPRG